MRALQGIARFKLHEGKGEEFKRLSAQAMEIVRTKDSEALIEHRAHLGDLAKAILTTVSVSGELLGKPSPELRAKMAGSVVCLWWGASDLVAAIVRRSVPRLQRPRSTERRAR